MYIKIFILALFVLRASQCEPPEVPEQVELEEELELCRKEVDELTSKVSDLESQIEDMEAQIEELELY